MELPGGLLCPTRRAFPWRTGRWRSLVHLTHLGGAVILRRGDLILIQRNSSSRSWTISFASLVLRSCTSTKGIGGHRLPLGTASHAVSREDRMLSLGEGFLDVLVGTLVTYSLRLDSSSDIVVQLSFLCRIIGTPRRLPPFLTRRLASTFVGAATCLMEVFESGFRTAEAVSTFITLETSATGELNATRWTRNGQRLCLQESSCWA